MITFYTPITHYEIYIDRSKSSVLQGVRVLNVDLFEALETGVATKKWTHSFGNEGNILELILVFKMNGIYLASLLAAGFK